MNTAENNDPATDILNQPAKPRREGDASIIANEIDIALSPIALYADALLEREELDKRSRQYVTNIRRAVDDVAHAVTRLRELDRPANAGTGIPGQPQTDAGTRRSKPSRVAHRR